MNTSLPDAPYPGLHVFVEHEERFKSRGILALASAS
jgi:hypothetical protein